MKEHDCGYVIMAVNTEDTDYQRCAKQLAQSIRDFVPRANVCIITDRDPESTLFDEVKLLPSDRLPGFANDWYAFRLSPYHETIKLEADTVICEDISHWWHLFRLRDVVVSTGARDFYGEIATSRFYRRVFDENGLIDAYSAITYWRVSPLAREFGRIVRMIFSDWASYRSLLKFGDAQPSTDLVYAVAAELLGRELVTLPDTIWQPRVTHMKKHMVPITQVDWTRELISEKIGNCLRINTVAQSGCLHYHVKEWNYDR